MSQKNNQLVKRDSDSDDDDDDLFREAAPKNDDSSSEESSDDDDDDLEDQPIDKYNDDEDAPYGSTPNAPAPRSGARGGGGNSNPRAGGGYSDNPSYDDDAGDTRRKHKYSTADMDEGTSKKCKYLQIFCCVLIMIAIMIGISIGMNKLFNSPELQPDYDPAVAAAGSEVLPKNRDQIEKLCTEDKIAGSEKIFCETECAPYQDCCNNIFTSQNASNSCYHGREAGCYAYSKCHALTGAIDPAPVNLDRICSPRALINGGREDCEAACDIVKCCWDESQPPCLDKFFEACQDYSHCYNLNEGLTVPVASTNLDLECKYDSPVCRRSCNDARCCTDEYSDCYRDNFVACLSYMPCNTMNGTNVIIDVAPVKSRLGPAPSDLSIICSPRSIEEDSIPCETACKPAQCCWLSGTTNCFGADPLGCIQYIKCKQLFDPFEEITKDAANAVDYEVPKFTKSHAQVANLCGPDDITNGQDRAMCTDLCTPTMNCCNPYQQSHVNVGDQVSICYENEMDNCFTYAKCHGLNNFFKPAPDEIHEVCDWDRIFSNPEECIAACDEVRCCWDDSVSPCVATNYEACQDYAMCQNLRVNATIRVAPPGLEVECNYDDSEICTDACTHADECCAEVHSQCYRENFIACLSYSVCPEGVAMSKNIGDIHSIVPHASALVAEFCSPNYINASGIKQCDEICNVAKCCFAQGTTDYCFGADPLGCLEYLDCRILETFVAPPSTAPTIMPTSLATNATELVVDVTPPVLESATTNANNNNVAAAAASEGTITTEATHNLAFPKHRERMKVDCSNTVDTGPCDTACAAANFNTCCNPFTRDAFFAASGVSGEEYCFDAAGCYSYARCQTSGDGASTMYPSSNLARFCNVNAIRFNATACLEECGDLECCWNDSTNSCLTTRLDICLDYSPCQNLRNSNIHTTQSGEFLAVAPPTLDQLCGSTSTTDIFDCRTQCEIAKSCCADASSACYRDNFISCMSYATCKQLNNQYNTFNPVFPIARPNSKVPNIDANDISHVCLEKSSGYNITACAEKCAPSNCCYTPSIENSCFGEDPLGCLQYKTCSSVPGLEGQPAAQEANV